jgi:hypothetical protein
VQTKERFVGLLARLGTLYGAEDPPADDTAPPAQEATPDPPPDEGKETPPDGGRTVAQLEAANAKLRKENAERRVRANAVEEELKAFREAEMTETEKLRTRAEEAEKRNLELESSVKEERVRSAITRAASKPEVRFNDPGDAFLHLDFAELKFDEETGMPDGRSVTAALKRLLDEKPYLAATQDFGSADGGTRGSGPPTFEDKVAKYTKEFQDKGYVPAQ